MARDWVKMRTELYRDPKVVLMANVVAQRLASSSCNVTRNVTRNAVVGALVTVWGILRHNGRRTDDDLVIAKGDLQMIDDISELPGMGEAMQEVEWVILDGGGLRFPSFFSENNADPNEDKAAKNAERQRRYRESRAKGKAETNDKSNVTRNVTRNVTGNAREEENREEKNVVIETQEAQGTPKAAREFFRKPSVQDVAEYATGICVNVDPQAFCDHYTSNGWRVGKAAMKDWKAAVRNWAKRDLEGHSNGRAAVTRETPIERAIRNEQQQLDVFQQMYDAAIAQNARAAEAAEQARRDATSGLLGFD